MIEEVKDIRAELWQQNSHVRSYILIGDTKYIQTYKTSQQRMQVLLDNLNNKKMNPEIENEVNLVKMSISQYTKVLDQEILTREKMGRDEALNLVVVVGQANEQVEIFIDRFVKLIYDDAEILERQNRDAVVSMYQVMIISNLLMLVLAACGSIWLARRISRPLAMVVEAAQCIVLGDLRNKPPLEVVVMTF